MRKSILTLISVLMGLLLGACVTEEPQATAEKPRVTAGKPQDTVVIPRDTVVVPRDTVAVPRDTVVVSRDTVVVSPDTKVEPLGIYLILDSAGYNPDYWKPRPLTAKLDSVPLLTEQDIEIYQWESHRFLLSEAANAKMNAFPASVHGLPFAVCLGGTPIYTGAFWAPTSSMSFTGVAIYNYKFNDTGWLQLKLGFPHASFFTGSDPRSDKRIRDRLEAAGKLK